VTVEELIVDAWHIFPDQILGVPAWIRTAGYDILAKPPTGAKPSEANLMFQALLKTDSGSPCKMRQENYRSRLW
jgi:uncharacterized protein (TIGR03435 family)